MDQNERMRLQKQYEQYADAQVLAMLQDGQDAFVEGAYDLLEQEAQRRGISLSSAAIPEVPPDADTAATQPEAFVEIIVINRDADQQAVAGLLDATDIPYHFLRISVAGKALPVALMVDQQRIEDAVAKLQSIQLTGSIILW